MASSEEGKVIACNSVEEWKKHFQEGVESKKLVVVDFTATWCPPCRFIAPFFTELANNLLHVIFLNVDVDELKDVAKEYEVRAMPTFLFLKEGKEVDRIVGASREELEAKSTKHGALAA